MKKQVILATALCIGLIGLVLTQGQLRFIQKHWIDEDLKQVIVLIDESIATGADGACEAAGRLFHAITSQGYLLYVISPTGFVPSLVNPMDAEWTEKLIRD